MVNDCVDLLVVGGGINGTGIARDAAGRGLTVALVEQGDLASATSSASTKLIHGGLRYLELFDFRLVRESLLERERLLALAPHIIFPMQFVLPHAHALRPRWQIRLGLWVYDHLGGRKRLPASHGIALQRSPYASALREELRHGFVYADCWVDDSRLVVLNALDAAERGATILTRTKFLGARCESGRWHAACEDARTGHRLQIAARAVVNAAGPWVEKVLRDVPDVQIPTQIRLVKGSHIVVPQLYEGEHAFLLQNPDGRIVFTLPYEHRFTLIGTTDVAYEGDPAQAAISAQETHYLCETVGRYFRNPVTPQHVRWTYAGVRPLVDDANVSASKVTRDYRLELALGASGAPFLSILGGKLTTYRRLAEMALEKILPQLDIASAEWTGRVPLPGGDMPNADFGRFLHEAKLRWPFLSDALAYRLARAYGTRLEKMLSGARTLQDLGEHFGAGLTETEVSYLRTTEWASTVEDILWRRTKLGLHMSQAGQARFGEYMNRR